MTERERLLEKLGKVKALADRGEGGEKESAERTLAALMKRYGVTEEELEAEFSRLAEQYGLKVEQVKAAVPDEDLKKDLRLKKASSLVIAEAKSGKAKKKAAAAQ